MSAFDSAPIVTAVLAEAKRRGISHAELARRLDIDQAVITRLARAAGEGLRLASLARLLSAVGLTWGWLDAAAPLEPVPPPPPRPCKHCGAQLNRPGKKYCSYECFRAVTSGVKMSLPERAALRKKVVELRKAGHTGRQISEITGYTEVYVWQIIRQKRRKKKKA